MRAQKHRVAQCSALLYRPVITHAIRLLSMPGPEGEAPSHFQSVVVPQHDAFTQTQPFLHGMSKDVEEVEDGENGENGESGDAGRLEVGGRST